MPSSSSSESENQGVEDNIPQRAFKRRKGWLRGQRVPLTTRRRWLANNMRAESEEQAGAPDSTDTSEEEEEEKEHEPQLSAEQINQEYNHGIGHLQRASSISSSASSVSSVTLDNSSNSSMDSSECDGNSSEADEVPNDVPMSVPLFPGSKCTKGKAVCNLLDLCCKHAVSKSLMADLVEYTYKLLPRPNTFPHSMYYFEQNIHPFIPPNLCVTHYCCQNCGTYLGTDADRETKCVCEETAEKSFYEFPLETQIKYLFEERNLADAIDSYKDKAENISDITKGEEYLKVKSELTGKYDIVLRTSADGLRPHKNSNEEIWALTYTICEVPPSLRKAFTLVTQIWCGDTKPVMNAYLVPFCKSLHHMYHIGVEWQHPKTKEMHTTRGTAPVHTLDAPARAMLQNITQHGGYFSCNVCEIEGESIKFGKGSKTIYPFTEDVVLREKSAMETQEECVLDSGVITKGIKGCSALSTIPLCNRASSLIMDNMHLVLLGVTRQFFQAWVKGSKKGKNGKYQRNAWYIGHRSKIITDFLSLIKRIYEFTRFPKYVSKYKTFKASTWLVWLLFVSVPALHHNLPPEYFQHWLLLVIAMNLLLQEVISEDDIETATLLLSVFVEEAESLYGKQIMNYNVHGLLHLPLMVKRWGGLWATSTFPFEGFNAVIIRNLHGIIHISQEFSNVFARHVANATLKNLLSIDDEECGSGPVVKGKVFHAQLNAEELELLHQLCPSAQQPISLHGRVQLGKTIYTSLSYTAEKATNNKIVCFKRNGIKAYGVISYFHQSQDLIVAFINVFGVDLDLRFQHFETQMYLSHIIPIFDTEEICVVPFQDIVCKVIKVGHYVCVPPNRFERNL